MTRALKLFLAASAFSACAPELTGPRTNLESLPAGLDVQLTVAPGEVDQHAPFLAHLTVTNTTERTVQVTTAHGCLAVPHVIRGEQRIPFRGSWWGCTAAITTHSFAPGETRSHTWDMRAELYAQEQGDVDGAPAPKGTYVVQAEFDTFAESGTLTKPRIERVLRVR